jgi:lipopolysaccharide transport system permease protein
LILFASIIVFNFFAECVSRAPGLMLEDSRYIKRVVFPLEVLPWVCLTGALFHACVSAGILMVGYLLLLGPPPLSALLVPIACLPLIFLTLGLMWLFASLGVYLRDLRLLVNVAITFMLFLSPVFYPLSAVKGLAKSLLRLNPLACVLEQMRGALFWGATLDWPAFFVVLAASFVTAWLGYCWFMQTKRGFADVV